MKLKETSVAGKIAIYGLFLLILVQPFPAAAQGKTPLSISMENYHYPYDVAFLPLTIEGQDLRMAWRPGSSHTVTKAGGVGREVTRIE